MAKRITKKPALRAYRKRNKLSVDECGAKIRVAGSTWRSYENGTREVDADTCLLIEKKLGIDPVLVRADLFRRKQKPEPAELATA